MNKLTVKRYQLKILLTIYALSRNIHFIINKILIRIMQFLSLFLAFVPNMF